MLEFFCPCSENARAMVNSMELDQIRPEIFLGKNP